MIYSPRTPECHDVLASGALRDVIERIDDAGVVRLRGGAAAPPGFLTGFRLALLGEGSELEIVEQDPESGALRVAGDLSRLAAGRAVELRSREEAPLLAARLVTGTPLGHELPPVAMRLATTRGTNALLGRRGARLVHLTTAGFEHLLAIGDQRRPDLFALNIRRPEPLPDEIVGLPGRLAADGGWPVRLYLMNLSCVGRAQLFVCPIQNRSLKICGLLSPRHPQPT